jgi:hypothetical protein
MTASRNVEEEHGTYTRTPHPHNGYYAGDFNTVTGRTRTTFASRTRPTRRPVG